MKNMKTMRRHFGYKDATLDCIVFHKMALFVAFNFPLERVDTHLEAVYHRKVKISH